MDKKLLDMNIPHFAEQVLKHKKRVFGTSNRGELSVRCKEIITSGGHAGHLEHCLAAGLGVLDWFEFTNLNYRIRTEGLTGVLEDYPSLAGLAGFHERFQTELGLTQNDRYGLKACRDAVEEAGEIYADEDFGKHLHGLALMHQMGVMREIERANK
jgi:hypothetical protein